jgi:hypothetical protein
VTQWIGAECRVEPSWGLKVHPSKRVSFRGFPHFIVILPVKHFAGESRTTSALPSHKKAPARDSTASLRTATLTQACSERRGWARERAYEKYKCVVLTKAADPAGLGQRSKLDCYHPCPLDFEGFRPLTRCVSCVRILKRSHSGPRTR